MTDHAAIVLGELHLRGLDAVAEHVLALVAERDEARRRGDLLAEAADAFQAELAEANRRSQVYIDGVNEIPDVLWERVTIWLNANDKKASDVRHGVFPLGMVQGWIDRAEAAEARVAELEAERDHYKASYRRSMLVDPALCCVGSQSGPNREMLLCGLKYGHEGDHSWATLPTFPLAPKENA